MWNLGKRNYALPPSSSSSLPVMVMMQKISKLPKKKTSDSIHHHHHHDSRQDGNATLRDRQDRPWQTCFLRTHRPFNMRMAKSVLPISLGGEYAMSTIQSSAASHSLLPCQRTQQTNNKSQGEIEIIARTLKSLAAH